jgi:hypothetical protein
MANISTLGRLPGGYVITAANGNRSRDLVTVGASQSLGSGAVLGRITRGAVAVAKTDQAGAGKGVLTLADPAYVAGVKAGRWSLIGLTAHAAGAAAKSVLLDPDGIVAGIVTHGVARAGTDVNFTISDGANDAVGDVRYIDVTYAAGNGNVVGWDPDATDGSQVAVGILNAAVETGAGETEDAVAHVRDIEADFNRLDFGTDDADDIALAISQLAQVGIIVRR